MAYNHQNIDVWLTTNAGSVVSALADPILTGANAVNYRPGYQPSMPQAIYAAIIISPTVTAAVVAFKFRPTPGSASGEIVIGTLTLPVGAVIGTVYYKRCDNVKLLPGGEVVVSVTTASTAGTAQFGIMISPNWDAPGNNAKMVLSA